MGIEAEKAMQNGVPERTGHAARRPTGYFTPAITLSCMLGLIFIFLI